MTKDEFIQLLDTYKLSCDVVSYASGQLDILRDEVDHASNRDDREAYVSGLERMNATIESNIEIRDEIRSKLINLFKGDKINDSEQ